MLLEIVKYPHPVLSKRAEEVYTKEDLGTLVEDMFETLYNTKGGIGLAAPQVGVSLRVFVINITRQKEDELVFINPMLQLGSIEDTMTEGCLSIPEIQGGVLRAENVVVESAFGPSMKCGGMLARCLQHEFDHLNGVLFIDRMKRITLEQKRILNNLYQEYRLNNPEYV